MRMAAPEGTPEEQLAGSMAGPGASCWQFGPFELKETTRELFRGGELLHLEPKPLNLLMYFVRRPGELVTKDELIESVWAGRVVTDNVVTRCVTKLREAFGDEGLALIKTVHGYGYRFTGKVNCIDIDLQEALPASEFEIGDSPPGRPEWELVERLMSTGEVWLGRHSGSGERRVFKFALNASGLTSIKREITLFRLLRGALPEPLPVVRLLDWNIEDTPSFLEIEHHPLGSLRDWVAQRGGLSRMPMAERLNLISELANAVSTIHSVGVQHKDLKPANVLVSGNEYHRGRLLLCDFGSGRVDVEKLGALEITRLGFSESQIGEHDNVGTLMYTAPEVLAGQLPTMKADIYALGVMLYQFVVGDLRRPLAPGWEREVGDELLREDIARAADIQPEHRLADAALLAQQIRTLGERREQIEAARRDERVREQVLRQAEEARVVLERARARRGWMYGVVVSLTLGVAASLWLYVQEREAEQRASAAAGTAYEINAFLNEGLLAAADPYLAGGGRNVTVSSILSRAVERLDTLKDRPTVHAQLSLTIGQAYANLGLVDEARSVYLNALEFARGELSPQSGEMQSLMRRQAWLAIDDARYAEARRLFDELYQTALDLPQAFRADGMLRARYGLARLEYEQGYYTRSVARYEQILADAELGGNDNPWLMREVEWDLAKSLRETHDWPRADGLLKGVQSFFSAELGAENPRLYWVGISRAYGLLARDRLLETETLLQSIRARAIETLGDEHPVVMAAENLIGILRLRQGRASVALAHFDTVLEWRMRYRGPEHYLTRTTMLNKGEALLALGQNDAAVDILSRARDLSAAQLGEDHPYSLEIMRVLAEAHALTGRVESARALFKRVLTIGTRRLSADNDRLIWAHYGLGLLYRREGHEDLAMRELNAALDGFSKHYGEAFSMTLELRRLMADPQARRSLRFS